MTQLLISVTSVEEAQLALENGADFIDLKDPGQGALGALPLDKIQEIANFVHRQMNQDRLLVSATIGDIPMQAEPILKKVQALIETKVDIIKVGFFEAEEYQLCIDALGMLAQEGVKLIAVLFAEFRYPEDLIARIKRAGFYGVMIDTAYKNGRIFLDYLTEQHMSTLVMQSQGMVFGLAGSLNIQHVAIAKRFQPAYIGFRGGVSKDNQREQCLDAGKIKAISNML